MSTPLHADLCPHCDRAVYGMTVHPCCAWWANERAEGRPPVGPGCPSCAASRELSRRRRDPYARDRSEAVKTDTDKKPEPTKENA